MLAAAGIILLRRYIALSTLNLIRWAAIGLHTIVIVFALAVTSHILDFDISGTIERSASDPAFKRVLLLFGLVIAGNLLGLGLLISRLFDTFRGICVVLAYEFLFLLATLLFLTLDYTVVLILIVGGLIYVAHERRNQFRTI